MLLGADPEKLDEIAGQFETAAARLAAVYQTGRTSAASSAWSGPMAQQFRQQWDGQARGRLTAAEQLLTSAARTLRENAAEQRRTSEGTTGTWTTSGSSGGFAGGGGGGGGGGGWGDPEVAADELAALATWLDTLGMGASGTEKALEILSDLVKAGKIDPGLLKTLAGNETLAAILGSVGKGLDAASALVDFVEDYGKNPDLPPDLRAVHAATVAALNYGASKGIEAGSTVLVAAIGTAIFPGPGTAAGAATGKAVGWVLGQVGDFAFDKLDDHFQMTDAVADQVVDLVKYGNEHNWDLDSMAYDKAGELVGNVRDVAEEKIGDAGDALLGVFR